MEQINCIINCIVHIISAKVDYRPFLFGHWDAILDYTQDGYITYFSYNISGGKYLEDYRNLYGDGVDVWYDHDKNKEENIDILKFRLKNKNEYQFDLVQLNLYHLFYERGSFRKRHQPHFIIAEGYSASNGWKITDPYYQWEGTIPNQDFASAFFDNPFGEGAQIDLGLIREPSPDSVARQLEINLKLEEYPLADALKNYITELIDDEKPFEMDILESVLSQFRVLYKTKTSYIYAYSYFADNLKKKIQSQTEVINEFLKNWGIIIYLLIKSCMNNRKDQLISILKKVNNLYDQEKEIKEGLWKIYEHWKRNFVSG